MSVDDRGHQPATGTMAIAWLIAAGVAYVGWEMARLIVAALIRGALTATRTLVVVYSGDPLVSSPPGRN